MSAYDDHICMDMNKVPSECLERTYWRRRLPPAFRFFLEVLSRELMNNQPRNTYAHSASFLENLLVQRDAELSLLPYEPYLDKLMRSQGVQPRPKTSQAQAAYRPQALQSQKGIKRCCRCGCQMSAPSQPPPQPYCPVHSAQNTPATSPTPSPTPTTTDDSSYPATCLRCGGRVKTPEPGSEPPRANAVEEAYPKYNIHSSPYMKDTWGMLMECRGREKNIVDGELVNSRSLAILLDY